MNTFEEIKTLLREKSGKKLMALSLIVFVLLTVIMFFAVFRLNEIEQLRQMDDYLGEIPNMLENRENELLLRARVYKEDFLSRAELGLIVYGEEDGLTDAERLERVRGAVSADSVSLLDGQGGVVSTTGPVTPEENFHASIQTLEPQLAFYAVPSEDGEEIAEEEGKGLVLLPLSGSSKNSLVFEFSTDRMQGLEKTIYGWFDEIEQMLSGREAVAYARIGGRVIGFQQEELSEDQASQLEAELTEIFRTGDTFRKSEIGLPMKFITLLGRKYLAVLMQDTPEETEILLTVPVGRVIGNGIYIAVAVSILIGLGMVLLQIYILRRLQRKKAEGDGNQVSLGWIYRVKWPGLIIMLAVTVLFSGMLLQLENRTNAAYTAMNRRMGVQYEIDMRKSQESTIRNTYVNCYRSRTQMLAAFLTEHPEYQTREGLEKLNRVAGTEYLMRFDSAGQELAASNSYTGFSAEKNLSEEYQSVLLGYPSAVVGPAADPFTGRMQLGTAILMTDGDGQPDGFLLAVYSAGDLNTELRRMSYENAVSSFAVREGAVAAAINDKDGRFIAHTDPDMIGQKADDSLAGVVAGSNFEGFAQYKGKNMSVSASAADGKTLLYMQPERGDSDTSTWSVLAALAVLLILALVYYPITGLLIGRAMEEAKGKLNPANPKKAMTVFLDGYSAFLTLFAFFALIASWNRWWTSFDYVFNGQWSGGLHLFSLWAALFTLAVTLFCVFVIRAVLSSLESHLTLRARTIARVVSSLVAYTAFLFLLFSILGMFGVDTKALMASAGIVSIAAGMGAQSMAADLLAGFFMMVEGTLRVGDRVSIEKVATGVVTDMGIRTTKITDDDGNVVILNNSKVNPVRNMSRKQEQPEPKDSPKDNVKDGTTDGAKDSPKDSAKDGAK